MKVTTIAKLFSWAFMLTVVGACTNDELDMPEPSNPSENIRHTCKMEFIGKVTGYDQAPKTTTRATSSSWSSGDKIYITFYNETDTVPGEAIYDSSDGWTVNYEGYMAPGSNLKCEARFFVNATQSDSYLVTINPNTEIYEDVNAKYTYSEDMLTVQASLTPKTGRIKFTGTSEAKINLTGITTYSTYSPGINKFTTSKSMITTTVASNGSTPYVYGMFSNDNKNISLIGSDFAFIRTCTDAMLQVGESGYMAIPSEKSHKHWRTGAYISIGENEIKMIPVAGLESGFFLIAETETTESVWNDINGTKSSSQLPIENISYPEIKKFIEKINNDTKLNFALPTSSQWQYAAKGGNKSLNYTYAGSNIPDDVAWYKANASVRQTVKSKTPNELGIYDMSGNVAEFNADMYESYNSKCPYICGGSYKSSSEDITVTSKRSSRYEYYVTNTELGVGFRLILTCP